MVHRPVMMEGSKYYGLPEALGHMKGWQFFGQQFWPIFENLRFWPHRANPIIYLIFENGNHNF